MLSKDVIKFRIGIDIRILFLYIHISAQNSQLSVDIYTPGFDILNRVPDTQIHYIV